jgi:aryl-alcohol dehydrogenase-like predicted oxidoreductase
MLPPCQHCPPCPPSLAYRRYVASTIIGATTLQQLAENIAAFELDLDPATLAAVDAIHMSNRNPNVTD